MKLQNSLYKITSSEQTDGGVNYNIHLLADCIIYKAHFPGQPVTPGVCIVEIAHELLEQHMQCPLTFKVVKNVKYLAIITPLEVQDLTYSFKIQEDEDGMIKVQGAVTSPDVTYTKFSFIFTR